MIHIQRRETSPLND